MFNYKQLSMTDEVFLNPRVRVIYKSDGDGDVETVSYTVISGIQDVLDHSDISTIPTTEETSNNPIIYDKKNILQVLCPSNQDEDRRESHYRITKMLLKDYEKITGRLNRELYIIGVMEMVSGYLGVINTTEDCDILIIIKAKFDELIGKERMYKLIPIYNRIFTDNLYKSIHIQPENNNITDQEIAGYIDQYQKKLIEFHERRCTLRTLPKYEKNEIVGAKDKEGNWWMSKILDTFCHNSNNMYYVEFIGWGEQFNEFIVDVYRIKRYNPRAHPYYRPAWKRKMDGVLSLKEKLISDKITEKPVSNSSIL
jgi:hypothetical protein